MNADDYARVAGYACREHPDAMQEIFREQPEFIKALGTPIVNGALGMTATRMLKHSGNK
jgi:hypothetical protein